MATTIGLIILLMGTLTWSIPDSDNDKDLIRTGKVDHFGGFEMTQVPCNEKCGHGFTCMRKCRSECVISYDKLNPDGSKYVPCLELGETGCREGVRDDCCAGTYCVNYGPKTNPLKKCNKCSLQGESCEHDICCQGSTCRSTDHKCI